MVVFCTMGDDTEPANLMMILSFVILPFLFFKKNNVPFYERLASFIRHFFSGGLSVFRYSNAFTIHLHASRTQERDQGKKQVEGEIKKKRRYIMSTFQRSPVYKIQNQADPSQISRVRACVARRIGGHDTTTVFFSFSFSYYYAPWQVVRVTFLWNKLRYSRRMDPAQGLASP